MRSLGAAKAKAHFLSLLDDVENKREPVLVTRNGRPVAQLRPVALEEEDPIFGFYKGKIEVVGDLEAPLYTDDEYEQFLEESAAQLR